MRSDALPNYRSAEPSKLIFAIALGLSLGYFSVLAGMLLSHTWMVDSQGRPVVDDFAAFWTAGHQALKGTAVGAYNITVEHAAEVATIGHPFAGTLGWAYPPVFFFVAALLALLPYTISFLLWTSVTLAAYAAVVAAIVRRPLGFLLACAAPWVLTALTPGQNGFLTAAVLGVALLCLENRPALSGIFLGLLSYKPQFGILFPFVLAFGGFWRTFAWACASALAVNLLAGAIFGLGTLGAFVHALPEMMQSHLAHPRVGWSKVQSIYSLLRSVGLSGSVSWAAQVAFSVTASIAVVIYWRRKLPFALKAALLACAVPLVTPYVFYYDLPVLAVTCAFLLRQRSFDRTESWLLASTAPCMFAFLWLPYPTPVFASLAVATMAVRRAMRHHAGLRGEGPEDASNAAALRELRA